MFGHRKTIFEKARNKPRLQKSEKYIQAQLNKAPNYTQAIVQVGPLCNRKCTHCYSYFGPHRKEHLEIEVAEAIASPKNAYISSVCLTDGEPFLRENKSVLAKLAQSFGSNQWVNEGATKKARELSIITNGAFAKNAEITKEWFLFMKNNGWDLGSGNHMLNVSCGPTYDVASSNYANIIRATRDVFESKTQLKVAFSFLGFGKIKEEKNLVNKLESQIERYLEEPMNFELFYGASFHKIFKEDKFLDNHANIPLSYNLCFPEGRGSSLNLGYDVGSFDNLKDMPFSVDINSPPMTISYNGEISFGDSQRCVAPGKVYGNIKDMPLIKAAEKMIQDPVFSAHNLGGIRFLSYLAQEINPDFSISGKVVCNTCQQIFSDSGLVDKIRDKLGDKKRTSQAYRQYLEKIGLPERRTPNQSF